VVFKRLINKTTQKGGNIMKMKAVVSHEPGKPFEIQEVDLEEPRSNEVLVRITGAGLCHTDVFFKALIPMPAVFGHEGSGIVEKVGDSVTEVKPGDPVVISYKSCGKCKKCLAGEPFYCLNFNLINASGARADGSMPISKDGAPLYSAFFGQSSFAEFSLANERNVVKIPRDVPLELFGPMGCGIQTGAGTVMNALKVPIGSSIAVFGTGGVGMSAIMAAKVVGCTCIIGVDVKPVRLEKARELGATHVINAAEKNPVEEIQAITGGGANYTIETTALPAVFRQAVEALEYTGECVWLAAPTPGTEATVNMGTFLSGRKARGTLEGDSIPQKFIPELIELYKQGKFPLDKIVKYYDAKDFNQAVEDAEKGVTIKPIIRFNT
jgi:aryl-alcohol dehydrogenase